MTIQHLNLVFGAEGLNVGEGAVLMAYCNHTTPRGYVDVSMRLVADEAHMTVRGANKIKARLIERNLLKALPRKHPKNGAQIVDMVRVNVALLQRMQRSKMDYGPTPTEEIVFDETADQSAWNEVQGGVNEVQGGLNVVQPPGGERRSALFLPSSLPSSSSSSSARPPETDRSAVADVVTEEEEEHHDYDHGTPAALPAARSAAPSSTAEEFVRELPKGESIGQGQAARIAGLVEAALTAGWTLPGLRSLLAPKCGPLVRQPGALYASLLSDLPPAPATQPQRAPRPGACPIHPDMSTAGGGCPRCPTDRKPVEPGAFRALLTTARSGAATSGPLA